MTPRRTGIVASREACADCAPLARSAMSHSVSAMSSPSQLLATGPMSSWPSASIDVIAWSSGIERTAYMRFMAAGCTSVRLLGAATIH